MKKSKKIFAAAMALATVISTATACNDGNTASGGDATSAPETTTTEAPRETVKEDENVNSAVESALENVSEDYKGIKVDRKVVWMAWNNWGPQENSPEVTMFKSLYGTPTEKPAGFDSIPDENVFCIISSPYADRYVDLAKRVQADDSPDVYPFEICYYPYGVYKNLFQPVDDLFNFEADDWADYKDVIDMFEWGGKNYCPIMNLNINSLLWYRKSVVEEAGFDDPWELFEKGEWTWEKFLDMCRKFTDAENKMWAIDGYAMADNLVLTTGTPLVSLEEGKLVSNLYDANVEKALDFITNFDDSKEGLKYPKEIENNWNPSYMQWVNGKTLFFDDGTWRYDEHWYKYKKLKKWDDDEINFVPWPQMDGSEEYYQGMKQDAFLLVAGSKNKEGYQGWVFANLIAGKDPDIKAAGRQQQKDTYDWTDMLLDRLDTLRDPETFTAVFDFKNGIGPDIADTTKGDCIVEQLTKEPLVNGTSYTQLRESNQGQITARIEEMNATVQ